MNTPKLRTYIPSYIEIERSSYELRENVLITFRGKIAHTASRFQRLSHIMNIPPLRTYTSSIIEIERSNHELRENVLITSKGKIVLTGMRLQ
jgi:hypothetical protein